MIVEARALSSVPRWLWAVLLGLLALQIYMRAGGSILQRDVENLPPPPRPGALRLTSLGESEAAARVAMLYVQSFDMAGGSGTTLRTLDYVRLLGWLRAILEVDPRSEYPMFAAARVYAEVPDEARSRLALEFVYDEFLKDPNRRWPWLAHAALLAKHRLKDMSLALRYAAAIDRLTNSEDVPLWARQMQIFVLEDMDELEAARIMIGGLLENGKITDPAEVRFLRGKLEALDARLGKEAEKGGKAGHTSKN